MHRTIVGHAEEKSWNEGAILSSFVLTMAVEFTGWTEN